MRRAVIALLVLAACGTSYFPPPNDPVLIANPEPPAEVRAAVVRALQDRRFITEQEEGGRITARHERGEMMLRVAVDYDGARYAVRLLASSGFKSATAPDGSVAIEARGAKELKALQNAINQELQRPAKEAAEAEKHEREYRLMLEQQKTARAQANAQTAQANANAQVQPVYVPVPVPVSGPAPVNVQSSTTTTTGSQSITCCINGAFYNCPSQETFRQCMSTNPSGCTRDPSHSCR
jgi:hypothetical protein